MILRHILIAALVTPVSPALADLDIEFIEGAPKDRIVISNSGPCKLHAPTLTIDLTSATAGLIFDVAEAGDGQEVFQPLDVIEGAYHLDTLPELPDGATALTLQFRSLPAWQQVTITIDMDDSDSERGITVSPQELRGATVSIQHGARVYSAYFGDYARARVLIPGC